MAGDARAAVPGPPLRRLRLPNGGCCFFFPPACFEWVPLSVVETASATAAAGASELFLSSPPPPPLLPPSTPPLSGGFWERFDCSDGWLRTPAPAEPGLFSLPAAVAVLGALFDVLVVGGREVDEEEEGGEAAVGPGEEKGPAGAAAPAAGAAAASFISLRLLWLDAVRRPPLGGTEQGN